MVGVKQFVKIKKSSTPHYFSLLFLSVNFVNSVQLVDRSHVEPEKQEVFPNWTRVEP